MAKVKIRIKAGSKGKPLGKYIAEYKTKQESSNGKKLYEPKAKMTIHLEKWREQN